MLEASNPVTFSIEEDFLHLSLTIEPELPKTSLSHSTTGRQYLEK